MNTIEPRDATAVRGAIYGLLLGAALIGSDAVARWRTDAALADLGFTRETAALPVAVERAVGAMPVPSPSASPAPPRSADPTSLAERVGVPLLVPTALPSGYEPLGFDVETLDNRAPRLVWRAAPHAPPVRLCDAGIRLVAEPATQRTSVPMRIGSAPVQPATVGEARGLLIGPMAVGSCTGTHADGRTESGPLVAHVLAWSAGGVRYRLVADASVGTVDVMRLATSLA
jgi:hypothetical protein